MTDTIKPQVGKRYVMRNGEVTGVIRRRADAEDLAYVFEDDRYTWTEKGRYWLPNPCPKDLISEYIEAPAVDLTKIEKPFGLLDAETQEALKAWPHGWEMWLPSSGVWIDPGAQPSWSRNCVYRAKPALVERKPREWWSFVYFHDTPSSGIWNTREDAQKRVERNPGSTLVRITEVIE